MKNEIINDIIVSNIANSCNVGAEWLERLSLGEKENPAVIRAVAAGLRDSTKNIDTRYAEIIWGIITCCYHYFRHKDNNDENYLFFEKQIRKHLLELKEHEANTFDEILNAL